MAKEEFWKEITEAKGYSVSNLGRIKSLRRQIINSNGIQITLGTKILKKSISNSGYYTVQLSVNGKNKSFYIHRLVAKYFVNNPNNYNIVNHKDENKKNNCASNLEWCTNSYNVKYSSHNSKYNSNPIPIIKCDKSGKMLFLYKSLKEAALLNKTSQRNIRNCLDGKQSLAGGYIWKRGSNKKIVHKIYQYSKSGSLLNVFDSLDEASNSTNIEKRLISYVLKHSNRKTSGGYIWSYKKY